MIVFSYVLFGLLFLCSIYFSFKDKAHIVPYFFIPIFVFIVSEPLFYARYIDGIDAPDFLCILNGMYYNVTHSLQIPYRINETILYGTQQPIFYHLTPCYLFIILRLFRLSEIVSLNIMLIVFQILTALFMYIASYRIFRSKNVAIASSVLLLCYQYRLGLLYGPFRLGEMIAFMLVPLFILSVYELLCGDKKKVWLFAVSASLLYQSHMLTTYLYFMITVIVFIIWLIKTKDISRLKSIVYGSIIIFLINLWYLIPQIYEFLFVDIVNPAFYNGQENYTVTAHFSLANISDIYLVIIFIFIIVLIICFLFRLFNYKKYLMIKSSISDYNQLKIAILFMLIGTLNYFNAYNIIPLYNLKYTMLSKMILVLQFSDRFFVAAIPFITLGLPYIVKIILDFIIHSFNVHFIPKLKYSVFFLVMLIIIFPSIRFMHNYFENNNMVPLLFPQYSLDYFLNGISSGKDFDYNNDILLSSDDIEIHLNGDGTFENRTDISFDYYVEDYKDKSILLPLYSYPVYKVVDENNNVVETKDGYNRLIEIELTKSRGSFKVCQYEPPLWLFGDIVSLITFISIVVFYILQYIRSKKNAKVIA